MLRVLDLFSAAAGGWSLGMHRAGFRTVAACEVVPWRRALYTQNNPDVRLYDDVRTLTADRLVRELGYLPDIIVGSPPCQDISSANTKGKGVDGDRSGLYFEAVRLVGECRPRWFALENSANLRTRGADRVIDALEAIGYTCWPFVVSAGDVGANHERKRSWLIGFSIADADGFRRNDGRGRRWSGFDVPFSDDPRHAAQIGRGEGRPRGYSGLPIEACGDAANAGQAEWRPPSYGGGDCHWQESQWSEGADRCAEYPASCLADTNEAGCPAGQVVPGLRGAALTIAGCDDARRDADRDSRQDHGEMGWRKGDSSSLAEPWSDWNGGLAHHLRVDDGLSAWVAQSRIETGGGRGTSAASLIVEAFGDAVCPQIPEAIGRAILRVETALSAICDRRAA